MGIAHFGGPVAEWLRSGLQIREHRFDSGRGLHFFQKRHITKPLSGLIQIDEHS